MDFSEWDGYDFAVCGIRWRSESEILNDCLWMEENCERQSFMCRAPSCQTYFRKCQEENRAVGHATLYVVPIRDAGRDVTDRVLTAYFCYEKVKL